jgi:hypothetical protein
MAGCNYRTGIPDNSQLLDYACVITGRLASRQTFV